MSFFRALSSADMTGIPGMQRNYLNDVVNTRIKRFDLLDVPPYFLLSVLLPEGGRRNARMFSHEWMKANSHRRHMQPHCCYVNTSDICRASKSNICTKQMYHKMITSSVYFLKIFSVYDH